MPEYILYHAATTEGVHQCAYALLKYLELYNLKPPPAHQVVIYTDRPAQLEVYGSFFHGFELRELQAGGALECLQAFCGGSRGPALYLGPGTYPVRELAPLFAAIARGAVYGARQKGREDQLAMLGFRASSVSSVQEALQTTPLQSAADFIAQYQELREFRFLLKDFFSRYQEESVPNQVKLVHPVDAAAIQAQKQDFQQLPLYVRLLKKITGKGWRISDYRSRR